MNIEASSRTNQFTERAGIIIKKQDHKGHYLGRHNDSYYENARESTRITREKSEKASASFQINEALNDWHDQDVTNLEEGFAEMLAAHQTPDQDFLEYQAQRKLEESGEVLFTISADEARQELALTASQRDFNGFKQSKATGKSPTYTRSR